jgi:hypothetical protein
MSEIFGATRWRGEVLRAKPFGLSDSWMAVGSNHSPVFASRIRETAQVIRIHCLPIAKEMDLRYCDHPLAGGIY